jgi:hypothetical protein
MRGVSALEVADGAGLSVRTSLMRRLGLEQATSPPTISTHDHCTRNRNMGLIVLEALAAGGILVWIVWWTMFSGRDKGELKDRYREDDQP